MINKIENYIIESNTCNYKIREMIKNNCMLKVEEEKEIAEIRKKYDKLKSQSATIKYPTLELTEEELEEVKSKLSEDSYITLNVCIDEIEDEDNDDKEYIDENMIYTCMIKEMCEVGLLKTYISEVNLQWIKDNIQNKVISKLNSKLKSVYDLELNDLNVNLDITLDIDYLLNLLKGEAK